MDAIWMKRKYIEGCEPNHLNDYLTNPLSKYVHEARYGAIMEFLPSNGLFLDAGCGYGVFELKFLSKSNGHTVVGADVSGKALRFAKDRNPTFDFVQCDIELLPFKDKVFDCVVATEVIEHVPNPLESLKEVKRVCKNLIVITVPNLLNASFLRVVGENYLSGLNLFSHLFSKIGQFLDLFLSRLRWTVIGYFSVSDKDFFDCNYFGTVHRLYTPNYFLSLLREVGLRLISIKGTTLIPEILPRTFYLPFIRLLSLIDKATAKKRWKRSLVIVALCTVQVEGV